MGMTKALQERVFITANLDCPKTRFICVRYGNVLASRGSVIPLFHEQIRSGGPVTITTPDMTRFLLSLDQAVDTIFAALNGARRGETYIPRMPSAKVTDIARCLIGDRPVKTTITGIRPGKRSTNFLFQKKKRTGRSSAGTTMSYNRSFLSSAILRRKVHRWTPNSLQKTMLWTPIRLTATLKRYDLFVKENGEPEGELLR